MFRLSISRASAGTAAALRTRGFHSVRPLMAAGDTGSVRPGGEAAGDAFTKREKAAEEGWIKQEELNKLRQLREKLSKQKTHIDDLSKEIDEMIKDGGGQGEHPGR